jgi:hypothetical protein
MEKCMGWDGNTYKRDETTDRMGGLDIDDTIILIELNKITVRV